MVPSVGRVREDSFTGSVLVLIAYNIRNECHNVAGDHHIGRGNPVCIAHSHSMATVTVEGVMKREDTFCATFHSD